MAHGGDIHHIPISPLLFEVKTTKNTTQFSYKFMLSEIPTRITQFKQKLCKYIKC